MDMDECPMKKEKKGIWTWSSYKCSSVGSRTEELLSRSKVQMLCGNFNLSNVRQNRWVTMVYIFHLKSRAVWWRSCEWRISPFDIKECDNGQERTRWICGPSTHSHAWPIINIYIYINMMIIISSCFFIFF